MIRLKSSLAGSLLRSGSRAFVLCFSFANLCFLTVWVEMQDRSGDFFKTSVLTWTRVEAVSLDVLIFAVILWVPVVLAVRSQKPVWIRVVKWSALGGLIIPINSIRLDPYIIRRAGEILQIRNGWLAVGVCAVALAIFLMIRWEKLFLRVVCGFLTLLLPTFPLILARTAGIVQSGPSGFLQNKPLLPALPQKAGAPHILWILFDEWDQVLTFDDRPANLRLPELDRFRGKSFHAEGAYPPAQHTIVSVPSLISGKTFTHSTPKGASEMLVTYDPHQPPKPLTAEPNIFGEARSAGFNAGAAGWYLPLSRLYGDLVACPINRDDNASLSLPALMYVTAQDRFRALPLMTRLGLAPRSLPTEHIAIYRRLVQDTLHMALDPRLNLVFVHLNVPHGPAIFDAATASFSTSPDATYQDNLVLVDHTVSEVRQTLEQAGRWDSTTILLTSDHPLRVKIWQSMFPGRGLPANVQQSQRVPFLLKMAGEKDGMEYPHAMQTVVSKDLLLEILAQKVTTAEQVGAWLDTHPPRQ